MVKVIALLMLTFPFLGLAQDLPAIVSLNGINDVLQPDSIYFSLFASRDSTYKYEVQSYEGLKGELYGSIRISEEGKVIFEWFEKMERSNFDKSKIDERRVEWMRLCNLHNVKDLVHEMYTKNSVYYNHKPIISGHQELIEQYDYMRRENYSLSLKPLYTLALSSTTVFEIGQCQGSYGGKYILIWTKNEGNTWKIKMDSNI